MTFLKQSLENNGSVALKNTDNDFQRQRHHQISILERCKRSCVIRGRGVFVDRINSPQTSRFLRASSARIRHKNEFTKSAPWHIKEYSPSAPPDLRPSTRPPASSSSPRRV